MLKSMYMYVFFFWGGGWVWGRSFRIFGSYNYFFWGEWDSDLEGIELCLVKQALKCVSGVISFLFFFLQIKVPSLRETSSSTHPPPPQNNT